MLKTFRFWVVIIIQACGKGGFTFFGNLLDQVAEAYGVNSPSIFLAIFAFSSAITRAMFGSISAVFEKNFTLAGQMGLVNLLLAGVNIVLAFSSNSELLFALLALAMGFASGAMAVLYTASSVDMFGKKDIGKKEGVFDLGNAFGSFLFVYGLIIAFPVDDSAKTDQDDGLGCRGAHCFQNIFITASAINAFAFLLSIPLNHWLIDMRIRFPGAY